MAAAGVHRNATALAWSRGAAYRISVPSSTSIAGSSARVLRKRAVAVGPGLTQLTRTWCSRISYARQRVKCTIAALIVEYATSGDVPKWPAAEAMLITV